MPVADRARPSVSAAKTDTEKDQRSADRVGLILAEVVHSARGAVQRIQKVVDGAPGNKTAVFAKLGADRSESDTILTKVLDLANAHKPTGQDDLSIT